MSKIFLRPPVGYAVSVAAHRGRTAQLSEPHMIESARPCRSANVLHPLNAAGARNVLDDVRPPAAQEDAPFEVVVLAAGGGEVHSNVRPHRYDGRDAQGAGSVSRVSTSEVFL